MAIIEPPEFQWNDPEHERAILDKLRSFPQWLKDETIIGQIIEEREQR